MHDPFISPRFVVCAIKLVLLLDNLVIEIPVKIQESERSCIWKFAVLINSRKLSSVQCQTFLERYKAVVETHRAFYNTTFSSTEVCCDVVNPPF
jgi:hypothetical protein